MFDQKKISEDYTFFANLFNLAEKDQDDELYKKQLYVLKEEIDDKINQNSLKFKHDILLSKLMLEDYNEFPPKNAVTTQAKNPIDKDPNSKEEEAERLAEQENEFLRELHRINYLTFSPFALSFFDKSSSDNNNNNNTLNQNNTTNNRDLEQEKENEEKMLKMLNFNYDSFEINNDLLFNICQGFVDMNKLKEENLASNQHNVLITEGVKSTMPTEANVPKEESDDEETDNESINYVMSWVKTNMKNTKQTNIVDAFLTDLENLPKNVKKREKNVFFNEWKEKIKAIEKEIEIEEEMKKKKEIEKQRQERLMDLARKEEREKQRRKEEEEQRIKESNAIKKKQTISPDKKKKPNTQNKPNNKKASNVKKPVKKPAKKPIDLTRSDKPGERDSWLNKKSYNILENY